MQQPFPQLPWSARSALSCARGRGQELVHVAGENRLALVAERAQLPDKITHCCPIANFLRIIRGKDDARSWNFNERTFHRANCAAEPRGVEHHIVLQVMVEISLRFHAMPALSDVPQNSLS